MFEAIPKGWFSWNFTVVKAAQPVADIVVSWWRETGLLTVQGAPYKAYREGLMGGTFVLEFAGSVLARAEKTGVFSRSFIIRHADREYTLRATSLFGRGFLLLEGDRPVGSVCPHGAFTRRARIDVPEGLPLPVTIFIIWLAVILWKRAAAAA